MKIPPTGNQPTHVKKNKFRRCLTCSQKFVVSIARLTSRAQARGADDVLRDSGTESPIPRCLQRFVRPIHRTPLARIEPNTIISIQPPKPTAMPPATNAHQSIHVSRLPKRWREYTNASPMTEHKIGLARSMIIQTAGVSDHPSLELLCIYQAQAPPKQATV